MSAETLGQLDRPVLIERLVETKGTSGMVKSTWVTLQRVVWMSSEPLTESQRERWAAEQISDRPETRWCMVYREDMDPEIEDVAKERRLVYQGWIYEIVQATMVGLREGVELMTSGRKRVPA